MRATTRPLVAAPAGRAGGRPPAAAGPSPRPRRPGRACCEHVRVDQAGRPDHHVGRGDDPGGAQREQVGGPGPGPDEPDLARPRPAPRRSRQRSQLPSAGRCAGPARAAWTGTARGRSPPAAGRMSSPGRPRLAPCTAPSRRPASLHRGQDLGQVPPALVADHGVEAGQRGAEGRRRPAVSGSRARLSRPSHSTVPLRAARSCMAVMPGTVAVVSPGTSSRTPLAR